MKENKLLIKINRPVAAVFEFTTNPANTPLWIKGIQVEETNEWPIKLGTVYRNRGADGPWAEYTVSALEAYKVFELTDRAKNYRVRYTYTRLDDTTTEMEYFEWVNHGELVAPFTQNTLEKLKAEIESKVRMRA